MKDTTSAKRERKQLKMGRYAARLIRLIALGTQPSTFNPSWDPKKHIKLVFETPEVTDQFSREGLQEPYVINKEFTRYLSAKSKLGIFLNGLKPGFIPEKEGVDINYGQLIGMACEIVVIEERQKKDTSKKTSKIQDAEPLPADRKLRAAHNPLLLYELGSMECKYKEDQSVPGKPEVLPWYLAFRYLNTWDQKLAVSALEWNELCARDNVKIIPAEKYGDLPYVEKDGKVLLEGTSQGMTEDAGGYVENPDEEMPF